MALLNVVVWGEVRYDVSSNQRCLSCMRNKSAVFYLYLIIIWKVSYFVGIAPTCLTIFSHDSIQFSP